MPSQRPGHPDWRGRGTAPPGSATRRPPPPRRPEPPTQQFRPPYRPADVGPTQKIPRPQAPADVAPTQQLPQQLRRTPPPPPPPSFAGKQRPSRGLNRQTIVLIVIIVVALLAGGLAGAELYARHRADSVLTEVAQCVVQDGASISFGVNPPFLWQYATSHYTNISVATEGNRVQSADGMTADVTLKDVRLQDTADSKGTIGSLTATLSWKSAGIKDTVATNLPAVGSLLTGVSTDPGAGTVILDAAGGSITAKPVVTDGDLNL